jgi:hypothetical protein
MSFVQENKRTVIKGRTDIGNFLSERQIERFDAGWRFRVTKKVGSPQNEHRTGEKCRDFSEFDGA